MINVNIVIPPELVPTKTIKATTWEVSRQPEFRIENYIIGRRPVSMLALNEIDMDIDDTALTSNKIYVRVQYFFQDGTNSGFTKHFQYTIPDFAGQVNTSLIRVPEVTYDLDYKLTDLGIMSGFLNINSNEFRDYNNETNHAKTILEITIDSGSVIYTDEGHFLNAPEKLYAFKVPLNVFEDESSYNLNVTYVGTNGSQSGTLSQKFQSYLVGDYFMAIVANDITSGRITYFKIVPRTTKYKKINLKLVDSENNIIVAVTEQETLFPKLNIPSTVSLTETYRIFGNIILTDESETPDELILETSVNDNILYLIDGEGYREEYSFSGTISNGINNIQTSVQLDNGVILLGNNVTREINSFRYEGGRLIKIGTPIVIDDTENIGIMHLNIMKLYNGKVLINYGYNTKTIGGQGNVFRLYEYNDASGEFKIINQIRIPGLGFSTGWASSCVTTKAGDIYFIPAYIENAGIKENLKIYKMNSSTMTISKTINLPFHAKHNVNLLPTKNDNEFLILNGSEHKYEIDNKLVWKRENNLVYKLIGGSDIINATPLTMDAVDPYLAVFQGSVRRDGKIALFNSVDSGPFKYDHDVVVVDTDNWSIERISNDLPDDYIYRTTIRLTDGSFIRISTKYQTSNMVYHYPVGVMSDIVDPIDSIEETILTVEAGETKYFTSINFEKSNIEGTSPENTGKIIIVFGDNEIEYDYRTLVVGKTTTLSTEEAERYENIVSFNGAVINIY